MTRITRPEAGEFAPYFQRYIDLVPDDELLARLQTDFETAAFRLAAVAPEKTAFRYAPGKWSIKEVVGHMADTERVMQHRALRIARGDSTPLPGFDENEYVRHAGFDRRGIDELLEDWRRVRAASISLLAGLDEEAVLRRGTVNGHVISVRALAYIIAGHERHHRHVLEQRYGL